MNFLLEKAKDFKSEQKYIVLGTKRLHKPVVLIRDLFDIRHKSNAWKKEKI